MDHDGNYKQIFSHPEIIQELLKGFVNEEWVDEVDFKTLEKINSSFVSEELLKREDDIIWRVKVKERWLYLYLLIEFQSEVDYWMALRIGVYTGLLYQDLIKSKRVKTRELLPPVFPIVLYNGSPRWTAATELSQLIEPYTKGLEAYCPRQRYFILDELRIPEEIFQEMDNTVADVFRLESSLNPKQISLVISCLSNRLKGDQFSSLKRALVVWINRTILSRLNPEEITGKINKLEEADSMLAERVEQWTVEWKNEGIQQGIQQGLQQGKQKWMQRGEGKIFTHLLKKRFGTIPAWVEEKIKNGSESELEEWAENILIANTIDDIFN